MARHPEAVAAVKRRRRAALAIQTRVARIAGKSVPDILKDE